jgi:hypothetical protein
MDAHDGLWRTLLVEICWLLCSSNHLSCQMQSQSPTPVRLHVTQPDELSVHNTIHRSFDNATNSHESTAPSINSVYEHRIESATMNAITTWVTDHPYQTAMHVANGVILCTPAAITVPVFSALGFSAAGPAAGIDPIYFDKVKTTNASQEPQQVVSWATSA